MYIASGRSSSSKAMLEKQSTSKRYQSLPPGPMLIALPITAGNPQRGFANDHFIPRDERQAPPRTDNYPIELLGCRSYHCDGMES